MLQFSKTNIRLERKMQLMEKEVFVSSQQNWIFFLFSEKGGEFKLSLSTESIGELF
jgi:hypothetical protein